jgi:nucleoside-diphosphate-sugar epimerase
MSDPDRTDRPLTLAIFGASGATGTHAVAAARARGHRVRAIHHEMPEQGSDDPQVTLDSADVLQDDLRAQVRGADAVLSCLGVGNDPQTLLDPPPLYTRGTRAICDAMRAEGIRRLVVVSASFVQDRDRGPIWFKIPAMAALHLVFEQMAEMERQLFLEEDLDWSAVRPGWLMEGDATTDYRVQANVIPKGMIRTRHADLADFMVRLTEGTDWLRQTPALARPEAPEDSGPRAVLDEMVG